MCWLYSIYDNSILHSPHIQHRVAKNTFWDVKSPFRVFYPESKTKSHLIYRNLSSKFEWPAELLRGREGKDWTFTLNQKASQQYISLWMRTLMQLGIQLFYFVFIFFVLFYSCQHFFGWIVQNKWHSMKKNYL